MTHGFYGTPTYNSWAAMKQRCFYKKHIEYKRYGEKGIAVCDKWLKFEGFLEDMGVRPPDTTLDRIDPKGHYEPGNCRWASKLEQANNCSINHRLEFNGKTQTLAEWSREVGLPQLVIGKRIRRGWTVEEALTAPYKTQLKKKANSGSFKPKLIEHQGVTRSITEWADYLGFANCSALGKRLQRLPLSEALTPPRRRRKTE